ncbi:nuclear transport factor 2 family protein [Streptomyces flavidovirens]|uniref:Nuclear transport factor 2 family protein n=1 Tax=Streptomyces flavidovirens TaxID=67298 RepID=A0ABW6RGY7_9ACTN
MSDTRSVVEELYRRIGEGEGERESLGELFAEKLEWDIYGAETVPWAGPRGTREEAVEFFRSLPDHLRAEKFEVERILVDGEHAVALGHMRHVVLATGKVFDSPFAFHIKVEGGLITRYITFEDSLALARAFES